MTIFFPVLHIIERDDTDEDEERLIGVYTSHRNAEMAIQRLRTKPGFRDHRDKFRIFEATLDETHWTEGFFIPGEDD